jgi:hypothetical protein
MGSDPSGNYPTGHTRAASDQAVVFSRNAQIAREGPDVCARSAEDLRLGETARLIRGESGQMRTDENEGSDRGDAPVVAAKKTEKRETRTAHTNDVQVHARRIKRECGATGTRRGRAELHTVSATLGGLKSPAGSLDAAMGYVHSRSRLGGGMWI